MKIRRVKHIKGIKKNLGTIIRLIVQLYFYNKIRYEFFLHANICSDFYLYKVCATYAKKDYIDNLPHVSLNYDAKSTLKKGK